jgi:hypothetical protein
LIAGHSDSDGVGSGSSLSNSGNSEDRNHRKRSQSSLLGWAASGHESEPSSCLPQIDLWGSDAGGPRPSVTSLQSEERQRVAR